MSEALKNCRPVVMGLPGLVLDQAARQMLRDVRPVGVILFARNIESVAQVRELCAAVGEYLPTIGPDIGGGADKTGGHKLIAVDQEGGRVQRLAFDGKLPAARTYGAMFTHDAAKALRAARLHGQLLAAELRDVGATWALTPVVDLAWPETHGIIGDRAFGAEATAVGLLGDAVLAGLADGGCHGCPKHAPGHGRATTDSHVELPVVRASAEEMFVSDWVPYQLMCEGGDAQKVPFLMTAHVALSAIQDRDDLPATYDAGLLAALRQQWNFEGLWVADDLGMQALPGSYIERVRYALLDEEAANSGGCDVVLTCFSRLVHGMAGTVFDAENYAAFRQGLGQVAPLGERALAVLGGLRLPVAMESEKVAAARAELTGLLAG